MKLISWNIQWSRGVDGKVDPQRIVDDARKLGDFDVLCLQEVAANFPSLAGSAGENQFEIFDWHLLLSKNFFLSPKKYPHTRGPAG